MKISNNRNHVLVDKEHVIVTETEVRSQLEILAKRVG
jgi:hypothetical protein